MGGHKKRGWFTIVDNDRPHGFCGWVVEEMIYGLSWKLGMGDCGKKIWVVGGIVERGLWL